MKSQVTSKGPGLQVVGNGEQLQAIGLLLSPEKESSQMQQWDRV